jgi:hypothetical protein
MSRKKNRLVQKATHPPLNQPIAAAISHVAATAMHCVDPWRMIQRSTELGMKVKDWLPHLKGHWQHQLKGAGHCCGVVDGIALTISEAEKFSLEFRNLVRERAVVKSRVRVIGIIEPYEVVPMPRKAVTLRALFAKNMNRRGLFPKRPLGQHHSRLRGWKFQLRQVLGRIAGDLPLLIGFAG